MSTVDGAAATWRVARGLDRLRDQLNKLAPSRSIVSDGSIGDPAHCDPNHPSYSPGSDHCPDGAGVVRARDFTHDPAHNADMHEMSEALRLSRDPRIRYVIWNRRIFSATNEPWSWRAYTGSNPHDRHMHVSVIRTSAADSTADWEITMPLSSDDIKRVSDATAARVLGREWSIPGRTLAGTAEALLNYEMMRRADVAAQADAIAEVLAAAHNDSQSPALIPEEVRADLAQRIAVRTAEEVVDTLGTATVDVAAETLLAAWGSERSAAVAARLGELAGA